MNTEDTEVAQRSTEEARIGGDGVGGGASGPVAGAGGDFEVGTVFELEGDGVEAGVWVDRVEAEDVAVGDVVGEGLEAAFEIFFV